MGLKKKRICFEIKENDSILIKFPNVKYFFLPNPGFSMNK